MGLCPDPNCDNCRPYRTPQQQEAAVLAWTPALEQQVYIRGRSCVPPPQGVFHAEKHVGLPGGPPVKLRPEPKQKLVPKVRAGNRRQRRAEQSRGRRGGT